MLCTPPTPCGLAGSSLLGAAKRALEILKEHDEGFGPATAIASTRYASTLLASGNPQEAQVGGWGGDGPDSVSACGCVLVVSTSSCMWQSGGGSTHDAALPWSGQPSSASRNACSPAGPLPPLALQLYAGRSIDGLERALKMLAEFKGEDEEEEEVSRRLTSRGCRCWDAWGSGPVPWGWHAAAGTPAHSWLACSRMLPPSLLPTPAAGRCRLR